MISLCVAELNVTETNMRTQLPALPGDCKRRRNLRNKSEIGCIGHYRSRTIAETNPNVIKSAVAIMDS